MCRTAGENQSHGTEHDTYLHRSHYPIPGRMLQQAVQQGRSEVKGRCVPLRYVEDLNDARTPLAVFFSSLLAAAEVFSLETPHHPRIVVRHLAQRIHEME